jgi:hypothetical protein
MTPKGLTVGVGYSLRDDSISLFIVPPWPVHIMNP